jgi:hypothetical protein
MEGVRTMKILVVIGFASILAACDSRVDNTDRTPVDPPVPQVSSTVTPPVSTTDPSLPKAPMSPPAKSDVDLPKPGDENSHGSPAAEPTNPEAHSTKK